MFVGACPPTSWKIMLFEIFAMNPTVIDIKQFGYHTRHHPVFHIVGDMLGECWGYPMILPWLSRSYLSWSERPNWVTIFQGLKITGINPRNLARISPEVIVISCYIQRTIHSHTILRNPVTKIIGLVVWIGEFPQWMAHGQSPTRLIYIPWCGCFL